MVVLRARTRSLDNVTEQKPKRERRKHKRQKRNPESDSEDDLSDLTQVEKWAQGRPFEIIANLPASIDPPDYNSILTHPLMVKDSAVLYNSLWMSRRTWIYNYGNVFPLYWKKNFLDSKLEDDEEESVSNFSIKDKLQKMCDCTMLAGPHIFDIRLFILKDENIENMWQEEQDSKKRAKELKKLQDQEEKRIRNEEKIRKKLLRQQEKEQKREAKLKAKQEKMLLLQKKKEEMKRLKELQKKEKALKSAKVKKTKSNDKNSENNNNNNKKKKKNVDDNNINKIEKSKKTTTSIRDSIMIANLNMLASKDPSLGSLMKKVADGEAMPDEVEEFKQVIAMAKKMPAPPGWSAPKVFINLQSMKTSQTDKKEKEVITREPSRNENNPKIEIKDAEAKGKDSEIVEQVSKVKDNNSEINEGIRDEKEKKLEIKDNNSEITEQNLKAKDGIFEIKEGDLNEKEKDSGTIEQDLQVKESNIEKMEEVLNKKDQVVEEKDTEMKDVVHITKEIESDTNKQTPEDKIDKSNIIKAGSEKILGEVTSENNDGKTKQTSTAIKNDGFDMQGKNFELNSNESDIIGSGTSTVTKNLEKGEKIIDSPVVDTTELSNSGETSVNTNNNISLQTNEMDNVTANLDGKNLPSEQVKRELNENSIESTPISDIPSEQGRKRKDMVEGDSELSSREVKLESTKKIGKRVRMKESSDIEEERLTAFQLKYLKGATLMLEFLEEKYIRYYIPKDSIIEYVEEKNEYIISWITVHNERDISRFAKKWKKSFDKEIYFVRGCPSPLYSTITVTIKNIPKRFSPIVLNSANKLEVVQRYMAQILAIGTRLSGYNLWYQLDGYDDEDLAEYYRVEANEYENRIRGKRAKRASSVIP